MRTDREWVLKEAEKYIGVGKDQPRTMDEITEGRWTWPSYGWCGDFVTFILERAGLRDGRALNRVSLNGTWVPTDNIARLQRFSASIGALIKPSEIRRGDIVVLKRNAGDHIRFANSEGRSGKHGGVDGNGWDGRVSVSNGTENSKVRWSASTDILLASLPAVIPTPVDRVIPARYVNCCGQQVERPAEQAEVSYIVPSYARNGAAGYDTIKKVVFQANSEGIAKENEAFIKRGIDVTTAPEVPAGAWRPEGTEMVVR